MSEEQFEIEVPNVSEALQQKLEDATGDKKVQLLRFVAQQTADYLQFVREQVKDVENFWPFALLSHIVFKQAASVKADRQALSYLTDVELIQDPKDPRPFELVFHFKENPYFTNSKLSKKYTLPAGAAKATDDGAVTKAMREFEVEDLKISATTIDWKDDLCEKYPRKKPEGNGDDFDGDFGSFFHYFTDASDPFSIGVILQQDILPDVYDYFRGVGENCEGDEFSDEDDELDEEDELDDEEIDLEEPRQPKKKQKTH